jgi:hypothetical protein
MRARQDAMGLWYEGRRTVKRRVDLTSENVGKLGGVCEVEQHVLRARACAYAFA